MTSAAEKKAAAELAAAKKAAKPTAASFSQSTGLGHILSEVPELNSLVHSAVNGSWSAAKFQDAVENSKWWRTHSASARSVLVQQANDPQAFQEQHANTYLTIRSLTQQLGMNISSASISSMATNALLTGNSQNTDWLTRQIASHHNYDKFTTRGSLNSLTGQMAANEQAVQQVLSDYGQEWRPQDLAMAARNITVGATTLDTYKQRAMATAMSTFPGFAKEIQEGQTVGQIAQPYVQSMSNILEVNPNQLSVFDPKIRQAMQGVVDPTTKARVGMPIYQFEQTLRQDPRWGKTQNAKDTIATALTHIGKDFGFSG